MDSDSSSKNRKPILVGSYRVAYPILRPGPLVSRPSFGKKLQSYIDTIRNRTYEILDRHQLTDEDTKVAVLNHFARRNDRSYAPYARTFGGLLQQPSGSFKDKTMAPGASVWKVGVTSGPTHDTFNEYKVKCTTEDDGHAASKPGYCSEEFVIVGNDISS
ncbi:hypothetical protein CDV31_014663 [Fusarium ambrosium]|uniref:Uncharacterized protein n=1 Tax=Fusarium ambrosium TaxID=131363 RepID=A0A428SUV8_9HYPO|nr:hypothetical protein CDV31_014663 [Fusarium ambrosium]